MEFRHTSVLLEEVIAGLAIRPDGIYIDGTLGGGGHSYEIASRLTEGGCLIGIDQDEEALRAARERLAPFADRVCFVHDNYENMQGAAARFFEERGEGGTEVTGRINGILLDLGVSSYQLDNPERGFSYHADAPLDMRMDRGAGISAKEIVNTWSVQELTRILREYGEERCAAKIAANIARAREEAPLETTGELVRIIEKSIPMKMRARGGNPCKRTFQAIRIACNRELEVLENSLDDMIELLAPGGRLCIITFHSLEDRIVKNAFKRNENPCVCPPGFPVCVCGRVSRGRVVTRKPILPGTEELAQNRRSASAKLRIFEKKEGQQT
ncbi:MAG: 16S rRNA (cytosine(1402)-N(4))-methyltransferase RsmH [Eubacteriales bacterium]|nr:16S rRNA (cytosine(1402)-N(4))-methyltransferase RsmH [Eubacteriales bacterium]